MNVMTWAMTLVELTALALLLAVQPAAGQSAVQLGLCLAEPTGTGQTRPAFIWHLPVALPHRSSAACLSALAVGVLLGGALSALLAQISWITVERWGRAGRDRSPLVIGRV